VQALDLALLKQFLGADQDKLREMIAYHIVLELAETRDNVFEQWLVGHEMKPCWEHEIFSPAIDQLQGDLGKQWREIRDFFGPRNALDECTESIFGCFKVQIVEAQVEIEK
jgi:hypothetical protein